MARLGQAKENYFALTRELNEFLYDHIKGMIKGFDRSTGNFVLQLRHPKESTVGGRPKVLVVLIVENLRASLDYMTFELSVLNKPDLKKRDPQFIIVDSESKFDPQAKTGLRHLTAEQRELVEQLQPYNGNKLLGLLGEIVNHGKHRHLLSLRNVSPLDITFGEITRQEEYEDHFIYPVEKGHAIFAGPKDKCDFPPNQEVQCNNLTERHDRTCRGYPPSVLLFLPRTAAGAKDIERLRLLKAQDPVRIQGAWPALVSRECSMPFRRRWGTARGKSRSPGESAARSY